MSVRMLVGLRLEKKPENSSFCMRRNDQVALLQRRRDVALACLEPPSPLMKGRAGCVDAHLEAITNDPHLKWRAGGSWPAAVGSEMGGRGAERV